MADHCNDIVAVATDTIVTRRLDLLGYRMLPLGDPIDWHRDLVSNQRAPLVHWSALDPLDADKVGDSKVVWELNRHQWVVRLAQAWALTRDERYAEACISAIDSWLDANPPGLGINWASSLEVSYRLIAWCWVLLLIRNFPEITGEWVMKVLAAIWRHAIHVSSYLSYYFSPNTHLTGEALGLFYAGVLFREFDAAPEWRGRGMHVLVSESRKQISADGVHFEQSTCYQRYTIDIYQHFALLAARSNIRVPVEVDRTLQHMVDFLLAVRWPNGSVPVDWRCGWRLADAARPSIARRWTRALRHRCGDVRSHGLCVGRRWAGARTPVVARTRWLGEFQRAATGPASQGRVETVRDRRVRRHARRLGRQGESDDRRCRPAWMPYQQRTRPCGSAQPSMRGGRSAMRGGCRELLLHV